MLIGAHQVGIGMIGCHEDAHGLLAKNQGLNDRFFKLLMMILTAIFYNQ